MDERPPSADFDQIDDVTELRAILRETTARLQTAAQMGLSLATQNHALQQRLETFEHEKDELHQRLALIERDRRRMQDQSLLVDQLRETLVELQSKYSGRQQRRVSVDARVDRVERSVDAVREELDGLQAAMADVDGMRWRSERQQLAKAVQGVKDDVEAAECRIDDVHAKAAENEQRQASRHADVARRIADLQRQIDALAEMGVRCQEQIEWTAQAQASVEHEIRAAVAECNEMVGGHEAAIRALRDSSSPTGHPPLHSSLFEQLPHEQQKRELRGDSGVSPSLNDSGDAVAGGESLNDIFAHDTEHQPTLGLFHRQQTSSPTGHHGTASRHANAVALVPSRHHRCYQCCWQLSPRRPCRHRVSWSYHRWQSLSPRHRRCRAKPRR
ncbi:hypothetical protein DL89DRAFT_13684 [Linderina pennispora]|uniref:Uncharacterized protein n=1 Tax=Linderina pennispora TaxID=61395 RepID=A0A1Y1WL59_9FUNG|nr:uncharacterized protein DL89DRAFT_13684 [Linderina pennispora]ORX74311.1 hypothetical protein DL89DRAFT_13684 [Linderina pennispora]